MGNIKQGVLFEIPKTKIDYSINTSSIINGDENAIASFINWQKKFCAPLFITKDIIELILFWDYEVLYLIGDKDFYDFSEAEEELNDDKNNWYKVQTIINYLIQGIEIKKIELDELVEINSHNDALNLEEFYDGFEYNNWIYFEEDNLLKRKTKTT